MNQDKRREKRFCEENRVTIEVSQESCPEAERIVNALTEDISLSGSKIMTNEFFPKGTVLKMTFFLSRSKQIIKVQAEVRWTRQIDAGIYEMGVQFHHGVPISVMALLNHLYRKEQTVPASVRSPEAAKCPGNPG